MAKNELTLEQVLRATMAHKTRVEAIINRLTKSDKRTLQEFDYDLLHVHLDTLVELGLVIRHTTFWDTLYHKVPHALELLPQRLAAHTAT